MSASGRERRARNLLIVVTSSDFGGTESFVVHLAQEIDRKRFTPVVCSLRPAGAAARRLAEGGVEVVSLDMAARPRPLEMRTAVQRLVRLIDGRGVDVVQGMLYRANFLAAVAAGRSKRRPPVVAGQRSLRPMRGLAPRLLTRWTRPRCAVTVAVSEAVRAALLADGADPARVVVIPNGVDRRRFRPGDRASARRRLGLPAEGPVVGAVGRLQRKKGLDVLLQAAAVVSRSDDSLMRVALIGEGDERPALASLTTRLGLGDTVAFCGERSCLEELYPAFDAFALPSREEGSPNALLEAMACGLPVIASAVGGVPEIVDHEVSGLLIPADDVIALAAAMTRLMDDGELRQHLGAGARRASAAHDLGSAIEAHADLYERLLGRPGEP